MVKRTTTSGSCSIGEIPSCCKVESLVSVDERGQMVLPKSIRDRAGINPGDKLALVTWEKEGRICCINLIKSDELGSLVKSFLGPMMSEISNKGE
jgi:AbrB family looped-hinge helix DNA binding protein